MEILGDGCLTLFQEAQVDQEVKVEGTVQVHRPVECSLSTCWLLQAPLSECTLPMDAGVAPIMALTALVDSLLRVSVDVAKLPSM